MTLFRAVLAMALVVFSNISLGGSHTWTGLVRPYAAGEPAQLPYVLIIGSSITWGSGGFDIGFPDSNYTYDSYMGTSVSFITSVLDYQAKKTTLAKANVCTNPFISQGAKETTSLSDVTHRWLAAQEVFNTI